MSVGDFDVEKFARYSVATGEAKRRLLGELVMENEPLTKVLVAQLCGRSESRPGRRQLFRKEVGAERLDLEEALAAGRTGMLKAIVGFKNPEKGGIAPYAAWKIRYELQCAIAQSQLVKAPRTAEEHERPKGFVFEGGTEGDEGGRDFWGRHGAEDWNPFDPDRDDGQGDEDEEDEPKVPARPSSALADFVERRCMFRSVFRTLRDRVFGAYEQHARLLGFPVATHQLERALEGRGVRLLSGNLPGGESGRFFAGVRVTTFREIRKAFLASGAT